MNVIKQQVCLSSIIPNPFQSEPGRRARGCGPGPGQLGCGGGPPRARCHPLSVLRHHFPFLGSGFRLQPCAAWRSRCVLGILNLPNAQMTLKPETAHLLFVFFLSPPLAIVKFLSLVTHVPEF